MHFLCFAHHAPLPRVFRCMQFFFLRSPVVAVCFHHDFLLLRYTVRSLLPSALSTIYALPCALRSQNPVWSQFNWLCGATPCTFIDHRAFVVSVPMRCSNDTPCIPLAFLLNIVSYLSVPSYISSRIPSSVFLCIPLPVCFTRMYSFCILFWPAVHENMIV